MNNLWIYQSDRFFTPKEEDLIKEKLKAFTATWAAHGTPLKASFALEHHLFIILVVDDKVTMPSGCSIDASVHFIKSLENEFSLSLFNRQRVAYIGADGRVAHCSLKEFKTGLNEGIFDENTKIFNNAISRSELLLNDWLTTVGGSWYKTLLKPSAQAQ